MCKYLQNAPKTLANRREAPSCMPWLIAIVVSLFCCNWNCNSFVSIFPAHTHTHTHQRRHTHASRLCSVIYAFRCIVVVAVVTVTTASVFSSYTHTLTRTVGFFIIIILSFLLSRHCQQHCCCHCAAASGLQFTTVEGSDKRVTLPMFACVYKCIWQIP